MNASSKPLVSILSLTYKKFQYVYETLDSIFSQDYPNIEIVLGDDASPEFPREELEAYIQAHRGENIRNVVIYSNETNQGTVKNANRALALTQGDYVMGLSSDDAFYDTHVVSGVVAAFMRTGADVLTCKRREVVFDTGEEKAVLPTPREIGYLKWLSPQEQYKKLLVRNYISSACTYYSRGLLNCYGLYDEQYKYLEDYPYYLYLSQRGVSITFFDRITVRYRIGDGMSTGNLKTGALVRKDVRAMYETCLTDASLSSFYKRMLRFRIERVDSYDAGMAGKAKLALRYPDVVLYYIWQALCG